VRSVARTYRHPREHLDDCIALVAQLFERQIVAHWEQGILPRVKDDFSGTFVGGSEVLALLKGGLPATPEGQQRITTLDAAISAREEQIEAKLAQAHAQGETMPFDRLRRAFGLTPTEQRALWVLIAVEVSPRLRQLMRYLVNEATRVHADVGLLDLLVYSTPQTRDWLIQEVSPDAQLFRYRLVEPVGGRRAYEELPFLLRPLKVNPRVIELVHGVVRLDREVADVAMVVDNLPSHDALLVPDELKAETTELLRNAMASAQLGVESPAIVLSGAEGSGRRSLIYGAAQRLGCSILQISCGRLPTEPAELARMSRALVREAVLFRAVPLLIDVEALGGDIEAGRPDRIGVFDRELRAFVGPVAATASRKDSRPVALGRGLVMVDVPMPTEAARAELWRRAIGAVNGLDVDRAAARYPISGGLIIRAAESALAHAKARGAAATIDEDDIHAGVRTTLDAKLSALGVRITWRQTWSDLVLPEDSLQEIHEFIARVRHRRRVYDEWGFSRKMAKGLGLSALFAGPPGTGKTMVAGIIADELALDLYQIDLSRIVSKYVGETEKNLANVFDAAEAGHAILLFDEADSLFAKRTEVKSSVDRYANLEVNYLLQRMESFNGITILTTNLDSSIDDAFRRRISFRVDFPMPEVEDRERLWKTMLPNQADVAPNIDFKALARKFEFSGGYIRNAVLRAAFFAADEGQPIQQSHLQRAALLEYTSMGKIATALA
jgi:ATP-dependent 26S proteasome regulatory subunit